MNIEDLKDSVNVPLGSKRAWKDSGLKIFLNSDLRGGHDALAAVAKEEGIDAADLTPGQYLVFINTEKTRVKVFAPGNCIAYTKSTSGRLEMGAISGIPRNFGGGAFHYDEAVKEVLVKLLSKRKKKLDS